MIPNRKKRNSSKVNLIISVVFHALIVLGSIFLAAREGMLGKTMNKIAVVMVPKDKPPEKPKAKEPEKAKAETKEVQKVATTKVAAPPPPAANIAALPPATVAAAPPPATLAAFDFADGAKVRQADSPTESYKGLLESTIRQHWVRPDNIADKDFAAEIELAIDPTGRVTGNQWKKGSGNKKWDESVRQALAQIKSLNRPPPKDFPEKFVVRFDVQVGNEPLLSASN